MANSLNDSRRVLVDVFNIGIINPHVGARFRAEFCVTPKTKRISESSVFNCSKMRLA